MTAVDRVARLREVARLDRAAWEGVDANLLHGAATVVVGTFGFFAFNRFGGQLLEASRGGTRIIVIGVWGWLVLSLVMWLVGRRIGKAPPLSRVVTAVGLAHLPLAFIGGAMLISVGLARTNGPPAVIAVVVLAAWFPALLVTIGATLFDAPWEQATLIALLPYALWLAVIPTSLHQGLAHLL